jgi:protein-S-isoprenylcysteine O-methyltransferase Ste14
MEEPKDKTPGVIAPPPLIYLGFLVAGLVLNQFWPVGFLPGAWRGPLAALLVAIGLVLVMLGLHEFRRMGTEVSPHRPAKALATGGIYAHTRNPLYLALTLVYLGIAAATDDLWLLPLAIPLLVVMRYGVIGREERYLRVRFGEEYRQYQERVRRWV